MAYVPGDSRLVDQIVFELKSQGIFDQFRKECIADVDTKPAYQNLRQRVEGSVTGYLSRQHWKSDLNKNQLREKLRKHIHDSNFLDQGVERIVDQVVNPKVSSVFIPQVEDVVYNYLGIERPRMSNLNQSSYMPKSALHVDTDALLPNDLEAVSPDSVKSNESKKDKNSFPRLEDKEKKEYVDEQDMVQADIKLEEKVEDCKVEDMVVDDYESPPFEPIDNDKNDDCTRDSHLSGMSDLTSHDSEGESVNNLRKTESETFKEKVTNHSSDSQLSKLSKGSHNSEGLTVEGKKDGVQKLQTPAINLEYEYKHSDESSSDLDLRCNVSPLTPVHNYNNENSCDAQQAFEQISHTLNIAENLPLPAKQLDTEKDSNTFAMKPVPVDPEILEVYEPSESQSIQKTSDYKREIKNQDVLSESDETQGSNFKMNIPEHQKISLTYQFKNQMNLNEFAQSEDDSSCSNNLRIDYESDHKIENSNDKDPIENKGPDLMGSHVESDNKVTSKEDKKYPDKSSHHKTSRDSHRPSSSRHSKDKKSDSRHHSNSRDRKDSYRTDRKHSDRSESSNGKSHRKDSSRSDKRRDRDDSRHSDKKDVSKERHSSNSYKNTSNSHRDSSGYRNSKTHKSHSDGSSKHRHSSSTHKSYDDRKLSLTSERSEKQNRSVDDRYSKTSDSSRIREDRHSSSKDKSRHSSTVSYSDKDRKYSKHSSDSKGKYNHDSSKKTDKKAKKIVDDHYGASGRAGKSRRSTDRDSNDGNSNSSKGSNFVASLQSSSFGVGVNNDKNSSSKSVNNSSGNDSTGQSDKVEDAATQVKKDDVIHVEEKVLSIPVMRLENQLNTPVLETTKLPPIPEAGLPKLKKPRIASNIHEARKLMKVRKQMEVDEQKRQQEIALKIEMQENVQPNASQVFSGISGPELEFACFTTGSKSSQHLDADSVTHIEQPGSPSNGCTKLKQSLDLNADLLYFEDSEKDESMTQFENFKDFMDSYIRIHDSATKLYLYNCTNYGKKLFSAVCDNGRKVNVINLHRNGVKLNQRKQTQVQNTMVKNVFVRLDREVNILADKQKNPNVKAIEQKSNSAQIVDLNPYVKIETNSEINDLQKSPIEVNQQASESGNFDKSLDNSFELVNAEYYSKIDELMNNTSKQEIMEIILGGGSPAGMSISSYPSQHDMQSTSENVSGKRKYSDHVGASINNNHDVQAGGKMRKVSSSEQISSTTDDNNMQSSQSKRPSSRYTGKARRVGLPKPRNPFHVSPSSPCSDRSVENYIQNDIVSQHKHSAPDKWLSDDSIVKVISKPKTRKPKATIQRYDTSDLYKPKPHFLSRRSNIS